MCILSKLAVKVKILFSSLFFQLDIKALPLLSKSIAKWHRFTNFTSTTKVYNRLGDDFLDNLMLGFLEKDLVNKFLIMKNWWKKLLMHSKIRDLDQLLARNVEKYYLWNCNLDDTMGEYIIEFDNKMIFIYIYMVTFCLHNKP